MAQARPWTPAITGGSIFQARQDSWLREPRPRIFIDRLNDGNVVEIFEGHEVWHDNGQVFFPNQVISGKVYADYDYRNFKLNRRIYKNTRIVNDLLTQKSHDVVTGRMTLHGSKGHWVSHPLPILKTSKARPSEENIIPVTEYSINHRDGSATFRSHIQNPIYADYAYFEEREIDVQDYDAQNGIFLLNENVSFKDDLYAKYTYREDFYEYKGYYDEERRTFMHLDLNPTVGHYSTAPVVVYLNGEETVDFRRVPSSQLLDKDIHIYLVPSSEGGDSVRHCFSADEWRSIQQSNPMCLLLARTQVRQHTRVQDTVVMDARTRGGGIHKNLSVREIDRRVGGRQRYWDIGNWDGKAFYRNGVMIIELPKKILEQHGGTLSEEYVNEVIDKHIAYGTYYIIEWTSGEQEE